MNDILNKPLREQLMIAKAHIEATTEDEWITNAWSNITRTKRCFAGHLAAAENSPFKDEVYAGLLGEQPTGILWMFNDVLIASFGISLCEVNNGGNVKFQQATPKQRAIASLDYCINQLDKQEAEQATKKLIEETLNQPINADIPGNAGIISYARGRVCTPNLEEAVT